jgi:5-oxoprolinase (ATP-hydrolysing)
MDVLREEGSVVRTYVDRGGTFTDVVTVHDTGQVEISKVRSDEAVVGKLAKGPLIFGTTVATNALLEHKGVRTLLITNKGLADLPFIGDMARPCLFDSNVAWPRPLCDRVLEIEGRMDAKGREIEALEIPYLDLTNIDSVAVVFAHSNVNPAHEVALSEAVKRQSEEDALAVPYIAMGHELCPEVGMLARVETALVDAAITPVLRNSMITDRIPDEALAMRSDASLCKAAELRAPDAVLSGPAGGVLAVAEVARQAGFEKAVGLDMGGTSTDVCRIDAGELPRQEGNVRVAGVRIRRPILEVATIAAGGGSILSEDGLRLSVGPESAGANPGPQCYGRGGPPTLTDAALAAGLLDPHSFSPALDLEEVSLPGPADAYLDIARETMAQAVRRIATARGVDLRDHALVSLGGAAGQHAAEVAARLGIRMVLIHPCASVLSAFGMALSRCEEERSAPVWRKLRDVWKSLPEIIAGLFHTVPNLGQSFVSLELRHLGTDHALEVPLLPNDEVESVFERFGAEHQLRYGFKRSNLSVELVNVRVRTVADRPQSPPIHMDPWWIGEKVLEGPDLIKTATTSIWVPEGWVAFKADGLLKLEHRAVFQPSLPSERTPYAVELWSSRFMSVAEQAGEVLRRLARSVNIRERLDFSCAIFDGDGGLVANAPHIPVHLGAMGETVRDLLARVGEPEGGQAWLCNDPAAGGSHLPDLTVISCLQLGGERFFVASRAHHVDVGGLTPGSMPASSTCLADEGFVVRHRPLLERGALTDLSDLLQDCREPDTVRADLAAQVAANHHAMTLLAELGPPELLVSWMKHLQDVAAEASRATFANLRKGKAEDVIGGVRIHLSIHPSDEQLIVDFTGTGRSHPGNFNAPSAVVRAAVLYSLRSLSSTEIPLNEGSLRDVEIRIPRPSILAPPEGAAVAGGNVETSQRIADLFLRAAGVRAGSQGTMNNLTLGGVWPDGRRWSYYETIGGGSGATLDAPGLSAMQVHMTNTRATDVEVLEHRFPLRVREFSVRRGSGGVGQYPGGDGIVRELEVLAEATASLLATRRAHGAPGLAGASAGLQGEDTIIRATGPEPWRGRQVELKEGDRVRIETPGGGGSGGA